MVRAQSSKQTSALNCAGLIGFALVLSSGLSYAQVKTSDTKKLSAEQQSSSQPLLFSPQDKLDAIRQSLVEAALDSPTKIQSTTWIDANGSLRESSSFKNGMKVRGVKVLAYDRDEAGQAKAQLQISPAYSSASEQARQSQGGAWQKLRSLFSIGVEHFKKSWAINSTVAESTNDAPTDAVTRCDAAINSRQLRHLINFEMQMDRDVHPAFAQAFSSIVQRSWLSSTSTTKTNWKMTPGQHEPTMSDRMTAYESALVSAPSGNTPWIARLYVRTTLLTAPEIEAFRGTIGSGRVATLTLEVSSKEEPGLRYQESMTIAFEIDSQAWRQSRVSLASEQAIRQQIDDWGGKLVQWLSCEDVKPTVTAVNQQTITINAGAVVGVKKGDEWLIADSRNFPSQLLGKEGAPQTLLARVEAVFPYDSKLILAAGPSNAVQVNWRAWPADTVVKTPSVEPALQAVQNKAVLQR